MSREEFLLRMKNITNMYSMPHRAENMQSIHYACREYDKLAYEQQKEIERLKEDNKSYQEYPFIIIEKNGVICRKNQEIERLNNIINELEKRYEKQDK